MQSQRVLLLQGTESLNRATQSLDRTHQIAAETDQIGSDIIEELGGQREQLERTKGRVSFQNATGIEQSVFFSYQQISLMNTIYISTLPALLSPHITSPWGFALS